ncbi:ribbon-helix-helix protein, CopG family [Candidatus Marinimicrobia bacterium MT.SAG.2]|nr:ribbon-helix-helix protein, CopG family [Candidatus Marinimicrobia bacterium MT.SAG.2]
MKRINHHLTEKQIKKLKAQSKKSGLSASEIIRRALDEYLERLKEMERTTK